MLIDLMAFELLDPPKNLEGKRKNFHSYTYKVIQTASVVGLR